MAYRQTFRLSYNMPVYLAINVDVTVAEPLFIFNLLLEGGRDNFIKLCFPPRS